VRAVPRLCEFYPGICLTTEEKARKNLSQGKKNLSQVKKTSVTVQYTYYQNTHTLQNPHKHTHYKTHTYAHTHTHTHTHTQKHTLENNIKPPQYKLKQNAYRKSNMIIIVHRIFPVRTSVGYRFS
jgi:hypothetical protein